MKKILITVAACFVAFLLFSSYMYYFRPRTVTVTQLVPAPPDSIYVSGSAVPDSVYSAVIFRLRADSLSLERRLAQAYSSVPYTDSVSAGDVQEVVPVIVSAKTFYKTDSLVSVVSEVRSFGPVRALLLENDISIKINSDLYAAAVPIVPCPERHWYQSRTFGFILGAMTTTLIYMAVE